MLTDPLLIDLLIRAAPLVALLNLLVFGTLAVFADESYGSRILQASGVAAFCLTAAIAVAAFATAASGVLLALVALAAGTAVWQVRSFIVGA
jgi:glucose uptake protein GlcU